MVKNCVTEIALVRARCARNHFTSCKQNEGKRERLKARRSTFQFSVIQIIVVFRLCFRCNSSGYFLVSVCASSPHRLESFN